MNEPPIKPELRRLYDSAKKLAKSKAIRDRLKKMLANWPTRKQRK